MSSGSEGALESSWGWFEVSEPDRRLNPGPLHWKHRALTTGLPGKSQQAVNFDVHFQTPTVTPSLWLAMLVILVLINYTD